MQQVNQTYLFLGITGALVATILSTQACLRFRKGPATGIKVVLAVNLLYCFLMSHQGTSIEPEFWTLAAAIWIVYLSFQGDPSKGVSACKALALQILLYLWGQRADLHSLHASFWVSALILALATVTYMATMAQLIRQSHPVFKHSPYSALAARLGALILCLVAFIFKVAFTAEHTPALISLIPGELQSRLRPLDQVLMAQAAFAGCFGGLGLVLWQSRSDKTNFAGNGMSNTVTVLFSRHINAYQQSLAVMLIVLELLGLFLMTMAKISDIPIFLLSKLQVHFLSTAAN